MSLPNGFTDTSSSALPLHVLERNDFNAWREALAPALQAWVDAQQFSAAPGALILLPSVHPDEKPGIAAAAIGIGDPLDPYSYAHAPYGLPPGDWEPASSLTVEARSALQLGWGLGSYRFSRYKQPPRQPARLLLRDADADAEALDLLAACLRVRDLVNTPTEHMGPEQLEAVAREIAQRHGAQVEVIAGEELLAQNFPAIHAVGRASHRAPRLIALRWGASDLPHVALVGKGVCFDTGGLDIKPADGMRNMKKDMGGAAHALGLAQLVMARKLPVRMQLLLGAVENAIGPNAYRPGEVISTRAGISVEIDNTDAEGRVVLCDAMAYAAEGKPALMLDYATLTGAARIALGPDLPALFCNNEALANDYLRAAEATADPLWRLPLWRPYATYLASTVADMANSGGSRMAGAITAAIYLDRFVPQDLPWAHVDVYSWNDNARPGRPQGGEAQGLRAAFAFLKGRFGG